MNNQASVTAQVYMKEWDMQLEYKGTEKRKCIQKEKLTG